MAAPAARSAPAEVGLEAMKAVIAENMHILDPGTKRTILQTVMLEAEGAGVLTLAEPDKDVVINLDVCGDANPEVVRSIYNTVSARRRILAQPAQPDGGAGLASRAGGAEAAPYPAGLAGRAPAALSLPLAAPGAARGAST